MKGKDLRKARLKIDLTQEQLAELLGIRANTVWRYENDQLEIPRTVELAVKYLVLTMTESEGN